MTTTSVILVAILDKVGGKLMLSKTAELSRIPEPEDLVLLSEGTQQKESLLKTRSQIIHRPSNATVLVTFVLPAIEIPSGEETSPAYERLKAEGWVEMTGRYI